ncbi:MAG: permease [Hyphomicrobiales bacterium]
MTALTRTRPLIGQLGRLDPVLLAVAAVLLAVFLAAPEQGRASVGFTLDSLWQIAPYLVASIALAAGAKAAGADGLIANAFTGRPYAMIVLAAAFGALSPFCSCGVIPLIAAFLAMGVPLAPVMAFWLASPVIDPAMSC